jgi:putative hydrolase of the HAD superfamily
MYRLAASCITQQKKERALSLLSTCPIRAVLLDVDGTLYYQDRLRSLMALELCTLPAVQMSCRAAYEAWYALSTFRRVREELRSLGEAEVCLARWQYIAAAQRAGGHTTAMESLVAEWLYQRPLKYLRFCRRRGLGAFFAFLEHRGIQVGVFSDYPVMAKLKEIGCAERMSVALCATDPEINAFKPSPKGFLRACTLWGLRPEEVLYIGDRPEVDAVGAANAGMPCAILEPRAHRRVAKTARSTYDAFPSFTRLQHALS